MDSRNTQLTGLVKREESSTCERQLLLLSSLHRLPRAHRRDSCRRRTYAQSAHQKHSRLHLHLWWSSEWENTRWAYFHYKYTVHIVLRQLVSTRRWEKKRWSLGSSVTYHRDGQFSYNLSPVRWSRHWVARERAPSYTLVYSRTNSNQPRAWTVHTVCHFKVLCWCLWVSTSLHTLQLNFSTHALQCTGQAAAAFSHFHSCTIKCLSLTHTHALTRAVVHSKNSSA